MRQLVLTEHQARSLFKTKEWLTTFEGARFLKNKIIDLIRELPRNTNLIEFHCASISMTDTYTSHGKILYLRLIQDLKAQITYCHRSNQAHIKLILDGFKFQSSHNPIMSNRVMIQVASNVSRCSLEEFFIENNLKINSIVDLKSLEISLGIYIHEALKELENVQA